MDILKFIIITVCLIIFSIGFSFAEPIPIHVTKSLLGDTLTVSCEYMEKQVVTGVFYVYSERGEMVVHTNTGIKRFKESNILWYSVEE